MSETSWPRRPVPDRDSAASTMWAEPATLADLSTLRRRLRTSVAEGLAPAHTDEDDLERLVLTFEEIGRASCRERVL